MSEGWDLFILFIYQLRLIGLKRFFSSASEGNMIDEGEVAHSCFIYVLPSSCLVDGQVDGQVPTWGDSGSGPGPHAPHPDWPALGFLLHQQKNSVRSIEGEVSKISLHASRLCLPDVKYLKWNKTKKQAKCCYIIFGLASDYKSLQRLKHLSRTERLGLMSHKQLVSFYKPLFSVE